MNKGSEKRKVRNTLQIKENNKNRRNILNVFRSNKNIYAQIIDLNGNVLVSANSSGKEMEKLLAKKKGLEIASIIGEMLGKKAIENNIKEVVFNKGPYMYIGRIKALADGARKAGLVF
ncbi:MAG TPA: 50S ribosomal protein L18 [Rickettsiales bacterium]|nr:50S ribosomal protein L18 [Rickettsiales bacterium]